MTSSILSLMVSLTPVLVLFGLLGIFYKIVFNGFIGRL